MPIGMPKQDGRKLDHKSLETLRMIAVRRVVEDGESFAPSVTPNHDVELTEFGVVWHLRIAAKPELVPELVPAFVIVGATVGAALPACLALSCGGALSAALADL